MKITMAKSLVVWFHSVVFLPSLFLLCFGTGCGTKLPGVGTGGSGGTQNYGGSDVSTGGIQSVGGSTTMGGIVGSTGGTQSVDGSSIMGGTVGITGGIQGVGGSAIMGGVTGDTGGTVGSTGGIQSGGGVVGNTGGGTVGKTGGTVGSMGGTAGSTGGNVGSKGGTVGSKGGTVGKTGGTVGSTGGIQGAGGSTGGTVGSTGGIQSTGGAVGGTGGGVVIGDRDAGNPDSGGNSDSRVDAYFVLGETGADVNQNTDSSTHGDTTAEYDGGTPQYKLVWSDEFNVDGPPNPNNWGYENGFVRNKELQWYTSSNATVKNGVLVIEARKEQVLNPNYQEGSSDWTKSRRYAEYTSASLTSYQLQDWKFGRFEMRARIPVDAGMWPAWWTLGLTGEWPSNGEIDIMVYHTGDLLTDVACGTAQQWVAKWSSATRSLSSLGGNDWASNFHTWRMDWDDQKISAYLDDVLLNSVALSDMLNADGNSPFVLPQYMLMNLAVGGSQGGDPSTTVFPVRYEIDWVRVFQLL